LDKNKKTTLSIRNLLKQTSLGSVAQSQDLKLKFIVNIFSPSLFSASLFFLLHIPALNSYLSGPHHKNCSGKYYQEPNWQSEESLFSNLICPSWST
jgi:hypothetical protein